MNYSRYLVLIVLLFADGKASAATDAARIDINPNFGRTDMLSPLIDNWKVPDQGPAIFSTRNGVDLALRAADGALETDWWKGGLDHDATIASDCVFVAGEEAALVLSIRGLAAGRHSVVTYHNSVWNQDTVPLEIRVHGQVAAQNVRPTRRVTSDADASSAYTKFEAVAGQEVLVEIRATPSGHSPTDEQALRRVVLNGIEIDTVDPTRKARKPFPGTNDLHVAARPSLHWQPAETAVAHDVYLGTSYEAVASASPKSPAYQGRLTGTEFSTEVADHKATYFWRVDEVHSAAPEQTTPGDIWHFRIRRLAFPTAEGYGRFAIGGRDGRVIKVTTLADDGPGSLRAAIETEGPRTVVFDVGGRIVLQQKLIIRNPFLTIAGQTAPAKGICISNYNLGMLGAHDVVVRYMRVRPGDTAGLTLDGMGMASSDHSIADHCSISWTQDEAFSSRAAKNITLQRTLISEALNIAGHKNYEEGKQHGYAASIGGDIGSFHHNLLAHCAGRNWSLAGGLNKGGMHTGRLDIRNNVVYNWGHRTTDGGVMELNFVNNYYKPGPASRVFHVLMPERNPHFGPQDYYVAGNIMEGRYGADDRYAGVRAPRREPMENFLVEQPFFEPHVTTHTAEECFENVLADVGCNVPVLDEHDQRVIDEVRSETTTFVGSRSGLPGLPDSQEDVGGWEEYTEVHRPADWDTDNDGMPNEWERSHGLDSSDGDDGRLDRNDDGYTNLEEYLNSLVR